MPRGNISEAKRAANFNAWAEKPFPRCSAEGCLSDDVGDQYSFGVYAGKWCDRCWPHSGYRDAVDTSATFDPDYAGERLEPDY